MAAGKSSLFRQWSLLRALARDGAVTVKLLAAKSQASEKTVRRDLDLLRRIGFPIKEQQGDYGRKTYTFQGDLPRLQFGYDEALALHLCRELATGFSGTFVEQSLHTAFEKIESMLGARAAKYVTTMLARIGSTRVAQDYSLQAELLDRLFIAIEENRAVFLTYRSQRSTEPVTYDVYPYRLVEHRGSLYLFGFSPDHGENRTWKVDRMTDVGLTEVHFQRPDDTQITAQLSGSFGIFAGKGDVRVRIRFAASAARYVQEKRMHASQQVELQADGSAIVEFRLSNTTEVKAWVLSFGAAAEVIEPQNLRTEIRAELIRTLSNYDDSKPPADSAKPTPSPPKRTRDGKPQPR